MVLSGLCALHPAFSVGKSLQCLALQEVAPRPSEMTFYMKLVDIHVLKTMELKIQKNPLTSPP